MSSQISVGAAAITKKKYARICPNTNGWVSPSGLPKWSPESFPGEHGFGFDEWLLGMPVISGGPFAGHKAGFIQGFANRPAGFIANVSCYWIDDQNPRQAHEAICIWNCQKLSEPEARDIWIEYRKLGHVQAMRSQRNSLIPPVSFPFIGNPLGMVNVVFYPNDATLLVPPNPIVNRGFPYSRLFN